MHRPIQAREIHTTAIHTFNIPGGGNRECNAFFGLLDRLLRLEPGVAVPVLRVEARWEREQRSAARVTPNLPRASLD